MHSSHSAPLLWWLLLLVLFVVRSYIHSEICCTNQSAHTIRYRTWNSFFCFFMVAVAVAGLCFFFLHLLLFVIRVYVCVSSTIENVRLALSLQYWIHSRNSSWRHSRLNVFASFRVRYYLVQCFIDFFSFASLVVVAATTKLLKQLCCYCYCYCCC